MIEDSELLRRYAEEKSQAAFAELVQRHVNFVYACALRRVGRDAHLAQDVAQQVFAALARDATALAQREVLSGWLYLTTRNASAQLVRGERRRHVREQEAHLMNELTSSSAHDAEWERLQPVLDESLDGLNDDDRQAVLLRFSEGKSFADVGARLRLNENTARMRVERALEKMRTVLARRGVTSTASALSLALANQASIAAPAGLATSITSAVLTLGVGTGGAASAVGIFNLMSVIKMIAGVAVVLVAAGTIMSSMRSSPPPAGSAVEKSTVPATAATAPNSQSTGVASISSAAPNAATSTSPAPVSPKPRELTAAEQSQRDAKQEERREAKREANRTAKTRADALRRLTPLFQKISLTPEQQEQLVTLVTNQHEAGLDLAAANAKQGIDVSQDRDAYRKSNNQLHAEFLGEVKGLLGDDGYQAFLENDLMVRQSAVLEHLQKRLSPSGAQLSDAQNTQLLSLLQESDTSRVDDTVLQRAKNFLTPAQMETLKLEQLRQGEGALKPPMQRVINRNFDPNAALPKK